MSDNRDPWGATQPNTTRRLAWVAAILAAVAGLWELARLFPDALADDDRRPQLFYLIGWLALLSASVATSRRFTARETFRNITIWAAIAAVLAVAYTLRAPFERLGTRLRADLVPGYPVETGPHQMTVAADETGSFYVEGRVDGVVMRFLVDTGASDIVLSPEDGKRLGIDVANLDFIHRVETAHGVGAGAPASVAKLTVGALTLNDVPVMINQSPMRSSLLGMTFLRRLSSFEVRGDKLILRYAAPR